MKHQPESVMNSFNSHIVKIVLAVFLLIGCSTYSEPVMIKSISWRSQNPSILNDTGKSSHVSAAAFDSQDAYQKAVDELLDGTKVNGAVSLRKYIVAVRDKDKGTLMRVDAANPDNPGEGGGYASVTFVLEDGTNVAIRNLKQTELSGRWNGFWDEHLKPNISSDSTPVQPASAPQTVKTNKLPNHFVAGDLRLPGDYSLNLVHKEERVAWGRVHIDERAKITVKAPDGGVAFEGERRDILLKTVEHANSKETIDIQVRPPPGKSGKYKRQFKRDDPHIGPALREWLSRNSVTVSGGDFAQ